MKYDPIVKFNGKYYAAGEDVPEGGEIPSPNKVDDPTVESSVKSAHRRIDTIEQEK